MQFRPRGRIFSFEEKPANLKSSYAVFDAYIYNHRVLEIARSIRPPARGELEISGVNLEYLCGDQLRAHRLSRGFAGLDARTSSAVQEASASIDGIEPRQGVKIGCPEAAALVSGFISHAEFRAVIETMSNCEYRDYVVLVAEEVSSMETV